MISITKYLFEQDYVPLPQVVADARANSFAALRAKRAASLAQKPIGTLAQNTTPPPTSGLTAKVVAPQVAENVNQPVGRFGAKVAKIATPHAVEGPHAVDVGTWGNIAKKVTQTAIEK